MHIIYIFPPFFSQPPFLWLGSALRYYPLCQHSALPRLRACGPPPYNVIKDWCNANRCLEMVYVKSALKCHTAHTTFFFFFQIFLFDLIFFFALMERVRGPPAGSEVRGHRPGVQTATKGVHRKVLSVRDVCSRLGHRAPRKCVIPSDAFRSAGGKRGGPAGGPRQTGWESDTRMRGQKASTSSHSPPPSLTPGRRSLRRRQNRVGGA